MVEFKNGTRIESPNLSGQIAITEEMVKYNAMGWKAEDLFKADLIENTNIDRDNPQGWYGWKVSLGVYYFIWNSQPANPTKKEIAMIRTMLQRDGYEVEPLSLLF